MSTSIPTLAQRAFSGLKWNYAGTAARSLSMLLVGIVLARILGPKPFGEVAIAAVVISLSSLLADCGLGAALVQLQNLCTEEIRFAFWLQVLSGCFLALICIALSGTIAALFQAPTAKPIICALALMFPLQAGQTAVSLLKRRLAFRAIQTVQLSSYLLGYVAVGIPLAYSGFGVWALVIAQLVQTFFNSVLAFTRAPHSVAPRFRMEHAAAFGFGMSVASTNIVNWAILNLDNAFIGRGFGPIPLALYSRAYNLATAPVAMIVAGLQQVLFPASSRVQNDRVALGRVYLGLIAIVMALLMPVFAVMAAVPATFMLGLYGEKWSGGSPMLVPLALAMPLYALVGIAGPLMWGVGRADRELRAEFLTALVGIAAFAVASRWSALAVAWAVVLVYAVRFGVMTHAATRLLALPWSAVIATLRGPLLIAILTGCFARTADLLLARTGVGASWRLLGDMAAAGASVLIACAAVPKFVLGWPGISAIESMQGALPAWVFRFLPRVNQTQVCAAPTPGVLAE